MHLLLISTKPVSQLFGKEFPFAGVDCSYRTELHNDDLLHADCIIDLRIDSQPELTSQYSSVRVPVLIGSVIHTLSDLSLPEQLPVARFNHWPGFIQRNCIEFAVDEKYTATFEDLFQQLHLPFFKTTDVPGFVSARTVSMIINEAFLARQEEVSSEEEIDTAMKLGTSYPMGPFEWSESIGAEKILQLLQKLSATDHRYEPALSLTQTTGH
nr:3-hydroxyacyl-CoA dehydrogenase family protein [uncultured Lacibacter sp.]